MSTLRFEARWGAVVLFALAMAWMESATVVYLRTLVDRLEPYQANPLPLEPHLGGVEMIREAATLLMLAAVAWVAGGNARTRFAFFSLAFGVWDLFYYVFLAVIGPWPRTVWDWDVLFLLPLPWWGPVWAPASVALLMVAGGTAVAWGDAKGVATWPNRRAWGAGITGAGIGLYVFMEDAIRALPAGAEAVRTALPAQFNWPVFLAALGFMTVPVARACRDAVLARAAPAPVRLAEVPRCG
jgi:hypothetical protein